MTRILYTGSRYRLLDSNGNPFNNPMRLTFWDSSTSSVKEVYSGPLITDATLGSQVDLDSQGWGPVDGIWLDTGVYNIGVEEKTYDLSGLEVWNPLWMIHKVPGAVESIAPEVTVNYVGILNDIRDFDTATPVVFNLGYYSLNDGGQGEWHFVADSMEEDDGGAYLKPSTLSTSQPGRWHRVFPSGGMVDVRLWGAITGVTEVTSNIEKAQLWCSRTVPETGLTLEFPAGSYAIGTDIHLDAVGTASVGATRKVYYHFDSNSVFKSTDETGLPTVRATVYVDGPCTVDGTSTHVTGHTTMVFSDAVNHGVGVRPEWWGADPTGSSYDDLPFGKCWLGKGNNPILLQGTHDLNMSAAINTGVAFSYVQLIALPGSSIHFDTSTNHIQIGNIQCDNRPVSNRLFTGEIDAIEHYGKTVESSWFDISSITKFKQLAQSCNYSAVELKWTENYVWGGNYNCVTGTDPGANLNHTFDSKAMWFLENNHVQVGFLTPPPRQFIAFSLSTMVGTLNIGAEWEFKAQWFGAEGSNIDSYLNALLRSCIRYAGGIVFSDCPNSISSLITLVLPNDCQLRIRNLRLKQTDGTKGMFLIYDNGAGSNTQVHFRNCELDTVSSVSPQPLISIATDNLLVEDSYLTYGTVSANNRGATAFRGTTFSTCPGFILTNAFLTSYSNCKHTDSPVTLYGNVALATFANVYSKGNYFKRTTGLYDIFFVANGTKVKASNVNIDNTNCRVIDATDGTNGTWWNIDEAASHPYAHSHWHDIDIAGQTEYDAEYLTDPSSGQEQTARIVRTASAFRLFGVTTTEARVLSTSGSVYGINSGSGNAPALIPVTTWSQDWKQNDTPFVAANGQFTLGWSFFSPPVDNVLTIKYRVKLLL